MARPRGVMSAGHAIVLAIDTAGSAVIARAVNDIAITQRSGIERSITNSGKMRDVSIIIYYSVSGRALTSTNASNADCPVLNGNNFVAASGIAAAPAVKSFRPGQPS